MVVCDVCPLLICRQTRVMYHKVARRIQGAVLVEKVCWNHSNMLPKFVWVFGGILNNGTLLLSMIACRGWSMSALASEARTVLPNS